MEVYGGDDGANEGEECQMNVEKMEATEGCLYWDVYFFAYGALLNRSPGLSGKA